MLKVKVCGINHLSNGRSIDQLNPDFTGHIFYPKSIRNVSRPFFIDNNREIKRVAVVVNVTVPFIKELLNEYPFDFIQLHGNENPDFCKQIKELGVAVIKSFLIDQSFDFKLLTIYEAYCDFFLFDAKGKDNGGNGIHFDWRLLKRNASQKKYFISGGIAEEDLQAIHSLLKNDDRCFGIDINSKFEYKPGIKDIDKIERFIKNMKGNYYEKYI